MRPADAIFTLVIIALLNLKIPLSKLGKELRRSIMSNNVKVIVPEVVVGIGRMADGGIHPAYGLLTSVLAISGIETTKVVTTILDAQRAIFWGTCVGKFGNQPEPNPYSNTRFHFEWRVGVARTRHA